MTNQIGNPACLNNVRFIEVMPVNMPVRKNTVIGSVTLLVFAFVLLIPSSLIRSNGYFDTPNAVLVNQIKT